jgi:hypothetical protein
MDNPKITKINFLDTISYFSQDYKEKMGKEKIVDGIIMGISKDHENIIGKNHFLVAFSEQNGELFLDNVKPEKTILVKSGKFLEEKSLTYMENWPEKNIVLNIEKEYGKEYDEHDYGILISARVSPDTKKLTLEMYSLKNCPSISNVIYESIDEAFFKSFIGFDDQILRDESRGYFTIKALEEIFNTVALNRRIPKLYSELGEALIYSTEYLL